MKGSAIIKFISLIACIFAYATLLYGMWWTSPTADEGRHFWWSQMVYEQADTTRTINSVTPAPIINVLSSYLINQVPNDFLSSEIHDQRPWFFKRLGTLVWFTLMLIGSRRFASYTKIPHLPSLVTILICTNPSLLAHGSLVTVDIAFAASVIWFSYFAYKVLVEKRSTNILLLGFTLGWAFLAKFTAVLLLPIFFGVILFRILRSGKALSFVLNVLYLFLSIASVCSMLLIAYRFTDVRFDTQSYDLSSPILLSIRELLPNLPIPLPQSFVSGIDICLSNERYALWNVIFNDSWYSQGSALYFPFMYLYQTHFAELLVVLLGGVLLFKDGMRRYQNFLSLVLMISLGYFCFVFKTQVGIRYILFTLPLLFLLVGPSFLRYIGSRWSHISLLLFLLGASSTLLHQGNMLTFYNPAFVESKKPYMYLVDSNFDWVGTRYLLSKDEENSRLSLDPDVPRIGKTLYSANHLAGVLWDFNRNLWLRRNLDPEAKVAQTYFRFDISPSDYLKYAKESRTFLSHTEHIAQCKGKPVYLFNDHSLDTLRFSDQMCVYFPKEGVYRFKNSSRKHADIGVLTSSGWCESLRVKPSEWVPFYFKNSYYAMCTKEGFSLNQREFWTP